VTTSRITANRQIAQAAGTVMAAFILSNLTGLLRQILVTRAFGTGGAIDAFSAASTFPDVIFNLIAGGALASAFVPTLTGFLARGERSGGWHLSSAVINLAFCLLTATSFISFFLTPQIVQYILAPEFSPAQQELTVSLLRVLLISPTVFGISGLLMGILNAHQVFLWPALAPTFYWLGMIFGVVVLSPIMGIFGLAWGAVLGAGLHLAIQLPALFRLTERHYSLTLGLQNPAVREVGRLMGPRLLGVAVVQLNFVVNTILASGQPQGSLAAIKYAWAIMTMPQVVIAQAIAIAALPTFSAQAAQGKLPDMRASLAATLRGVILLSLPASLGLILLRQPLITLLFERGMFTAHSTDLVAWALLWYTAGLVGHSIVEIVSRAFYALHDTKTPVFVGVIAMSLNLIFSIIFSALFAYVGWMPHGGLALANSLATALEMVGLLVLMRRRLGGLNGKMILVGGVQAIVATLAMSIGLMVWLRWTISQPTWIVVSGGVMMGAFGYALVTIGVGVREVKSLIRIGARVIINRSVNKS
jgi:putative peptidoglycan lipid II flippase